MGQTKSRITAALLGAALLLSTLPAHAQEPVTTMFTVGCYDTLPDDRYRFHFDYWSDGVEAFDVSGGGVVVTESGWHTSAGYVEGGYALAILLVGASGTQELSFHTERLTPCEPVVIPTAESTPDVELNLTSDVVFNPTPQVDDCPAWSVESATGRMICLYDLPKIGDYQ